MFCFRSQKTNVPLENVLNNMKVLGKFYDYEINGTSDLLFQEDIARFGNNASDNNYFYYILRNVKYKDVIFNF